MKSKAVWALAVLNLLLLGSLWLRGLTPTAQAQAVQRSDYIMIPGEVVGGSNSVIYVVDTRAGLLAARSVDQQGRALVDSQFIDLSRFLGSRGR